MPQKYYSLQSIVKGTQKGRAREDRELNRTSVHPAGVITRASYMKMDF
jgi:hypothetical protein